MAANSSVARFRALTQYLKAEVHEGAAAELNVQADSLVALIESVAPVGATGELEHSVRKIAGKSDTQVRVVAGGRQTVRQAVSSQPYDYARADEFGTVNMKAQPFFFPSYRLLKPKMIGAMKRKIRAAIKKRSAE